MLNALSPNLYAKKNYECHEHIIWNCGFCQKEDVSLHMTCLKGSFLLHLKRAKETCLDKTDI
jgi:hypothetical protein